MNEKDELEYLKLKVEDLERKQKNNIKKPKLKTNNTNKTKKANNPMDLNIIIKGLRDYWRGHLIAFGFGLVVGITFI